MNWILPYRQVIVGGNVLKDHRLTRIYGRWHKPRICSLRFGLDLHRGVTLWLWEKRSCYKEIKWWGGLTWFPLRLVCKFGEKV